MAINRTYQENQIETFFCYSRQLSEYLMYTKHLKCIAYGRNVSSNDLFWLFVRGENLNKALAEWQVLKDEGKLDDILRGKKPENKE